MKNKIKLITLLSILFAGCLVGLQAFQNEKSEKNLFEKFKKQSPVDVRTFSKKLLKETNNNSNSNIKSYSLSQNKLGSLQKKNNSKVGVGGGVAKINHSQNPFSGDPIDYIPVIPLENQTDVADSTKNLRK